MNMISRDERKREKGIKKFLNSFKYPIKGLKYAYRNEQNLAVDVGIAIVVLVLGFILKINPIEWAILCLTIGLVISCELINTAIEAVVDLVTEDYHPLAKVAKDTSAAAVFIFAIVSVIVGIIIFLPKLISII
ncbi:MAG: diacylglycerol kinase family protein [Tenericutes bacterium]|nr:diacylglycerol kinase family protein [Mycoplasmatota bacterium]